MKLNMELVRTILIEIEASETVGQAIRLEAPDYSDEQISYHVKLLSEAGLVESANFTHFEATAFLPTGLTWRGHQFLNAIRDDTAWHRLKGKVKDRMSSMPFDVIEKLAIALAVKHSGL